MEPAKVSRRYLLFGGATIAAFLAIGGKLWDLQVVSSDEYQKGADENRYRLLPISAPRGIIYDRKGTLLVSNVPSFTVSIVPGGLPTDEAEYDKVLRRTGELLSMPVTKAEAAAIATPQPTSDGTSETATTDEIDSIEGILESYTASAWSPVRIARNVDRDTAFKIDELHTELPGVEVTAEPVRQYVEGELMSHLLGYVGRIPSEDIDSYLADADADYQSDDLVGLTGIERTQEALLRGKNGQKHIEVDTYEREVGVVAQEEPVQGHNLTLTIDLDLQRVTKVALLKGMANAKSEVGVAIAMAPRTGEVLAMVSLPSYDNNLFSGGISYDDYAKLSTDRNTPLVNHAISGQYPPGSTFKIVTSSAALQEGVLTANTQLTCHGTLYLPNIYYPDDASKAQAFYCWQRAGHGSLDVVGAITQSCDIFFYQTGGGFEDFVGLGIEKLGKYAEMYGFGAKSGIELSAEATGLVPTDKWKRQNYEERWLQGDTYNASIGQGYVLATPLQVLNATAAVANGGTLLRPQLVYQVTDAAGKVVKQLTPEPIRQLDVSTENLELVRHGLNEVVEGTHGTAHGAQIAGISVAGKTGTAQYSAFDDRSLPISRSTWRTPSS